MPMFPLGHPLLPGALLPLHVFEERYRKMIQDILADDDRPPEFGVVMIERGWEVGGDDARSDVGTVARILDMQVSPDGRYALAAVGVRRLRVVEWLPDDPYPVADVEDWPDADEPAAPDLSERIAAIRDRVREINAVARELGEAAADDVQISDDPVIAVYHLGALAPIGAVDRHRLLLAPTLGERLAALDDALDDAAAVLEFRRS